MEEKFMAVLDKLDKVSDEVNVNAVFGEPRTIEGRVLIPVAAVSFGMVAGAGSPSMQMEIETECDCGCEDSDVCECEEECTCEDPENCDCGCHEEEAGGVGGASGGNARPIALIEVTKDGAQIKPIQNEQVIALAGILMAAWAVGWTGLVLKTIFSPRR